MNGLRIRIRIYVTSAFYQELSVEVTALSSTPVFIP